MNPACTTSSSRATSAGPPRTSAIGRVCGQCERWRQHPLITAAALDHWHVHPPGMASLDPALPVVRDEEAGTRGDVAAQVRRPCGHEPSGSISSIYPLEIPSSSADRRRPLVTLGECPGTAGGPGLRVSSGLCHELSRGPATPHRAFSDSALVAASGVQGQCHGHWPHLLIAWRWRLNSAARSHCIRRAGHTWDESRTAGRSTGVIAGRGIRPDLCSHGL